jgi:hypothetical protein
MFQMGKEGANPFFSLEEQYKLHWRGQLQDYYKD